jgi:hypothetical protein
MANGKAPHTQLAFALVLAATGVACTRTALPLPMLCAGPSPTHASADHAVTPDSEGAAKPDQFAARTAVDRRH